MLHCTISCTLYHYFQARTLRYSNNSTCPFIKRICYRTIYTWIILYCLWTCLPYTLHDVPWVPHGGIPSLVVMVGISLKGTNSKQMNICSAEGSQNTETQHENASLAPEQDPDLTSVSASNSSSVSGTQVAEIWQKQNLWHLCHNSSDRLRPLAIFVRSSQMLHLFSYSHFSARVGPWCAGKILPLYTLIYTIHNIHNSSSV